IDLSGDFPFVEFQQDFLKQRAGFGIKETSFGSVYSANDSFGDAYVIGLPNTVRVAVIGIALATVVGVVAGIARLSTNWLVSRVATVYVEIFRNVPLAVQLIFWFTAVVLKLPKITNALDLGGFAIISNRAIAMPWAEASDGFGVWVLLLLVGMVAAIGVFRYRSRREEDTGRPSHPWWWALGIFSSIAVAGFFLTGGPLDFDRPQIEDRRVIGGLQITPEFTALLIGLVLYTGAFIAEIVRSGIQSVQRGQVEAAEALGLKELEVMRLVVFPQALRVIIPPLISQHLNLAKNSSLALAIGYPDLFGISRIMINQAGRAVPIFLMLMGAYLAISLTLALIGNIYNRYAQIGER
ncbi:MAG: ABC transporter permease subunit, partial [Chloroflexi bacterium]|nr:ABC transporter permease subunit [Chloroflexota bacterium]